MLPPGRVDELFNWLAGRPATCAMCGSVLVAIAGAGITVQACPSCDETPGTEPAGTIPHAKLHFTLQPGCPDCHQARRARI